MSHAANRGSYSRGRFSRPRGYAAPPDVTLSLKSPGTRLERISKMPQEDDGGCQLNHPEEIVRVAFPASDDAAKIVKPSKQALDFPSAARAAERPAVLGGDATMRTMLRNQFDVVVVAEVRIEAVAVVSAVADQPRRELFEEARGEGGVHEGDFMWRSAGHVDGDRKTMAVANRHDFAALTAASRADGGAPFFAELKLASMKASLRSSFPRSRRSSASRCKMRSNRPLRCQG